MTDDHLTSEKLYKVWEFCKDSQTLFDEWNYKTVSKYLINKWEEEMIERKLIEKIDYTGSPCHVLIHFPWEGPRHFSFWIDSKKEKLKELREKLLKCEKTALEKIRELE